MDNILFDFSQIHYRLHPEVIAANPINNQKSC